MRRRWLLLSIAAVAVLFAAAITLLSTLAGAPFRFLDGHSPLPFGPDKAVMRDLGISSERDTFYSFEADYDRLIRAIGAEVEPLGFQIDHSGGSHASGWRRGHETIKVYHGYRVKQVSADIIVPMVLGGGDEKGWVLVKLEWASKGSLWDRLMQLFSR